MNRTREDALDDFVQGVDTIGDDEMGYISIDGDQFQKRGDDGSLLIVERASSAVQIDVYTSRGSMLLNPDEAVRLAEHLKWLAS